MKRADVLKGKGLLAAWAKARAACDAVPVVHGRTQHRSFDDVADERNLRREVDDWLWEHSVALIEAAENVHVKGDGQ